MNISVKEFKVFPETGILWSPVEVFGQLIHPGVEIDFCERMRFIVFDDVSNDSRIRS